MVIFKVNGQSSTSISWVDVSRTRKLRLAISGEWRGDIDQILLSHFVYRCLFFPVSLACAKHIIFYDLQSVILINCSWYSQHISIVVRGSFVYSSRGPTTSSCGCVAFRSSPLRNLQPNMRQKVEYALLTVTLESIKGANRAAKHWCVLCVSFTDKVFDVTSDEWS